MNTAEMLPTAPDRKTLRRYFDEAVETINPYRGHKLTTGFYAKTGDAVFAAGYAALCDTCSGARRMHTIAAPPGGGKTSFSYALIAAVTRYAENNHRAPYGCVFIVDQIKKADDIYRDLIKLFPTLHDKVAIWTTEHDVNCKVSNEKRKVRDPAARFSRAELPKYPVIIVTSKFFTDSNGHYARDVTRDNQTTQRALTLVDERPEEVKTYDVTLSEAQVAREALQEAYPETKEHLDNLFRFMEDFSYKAANKLYRPRINLAPEAIKRLQWFSTDYATNLAHSACNITGLDRLFGFAKAMVLGCGYVITGNPVRFVGYTSELVINLTAGTVLLDATSDVDGISPLVPWREAAEAPEASYENLEIILVRPYTRERLSTFFKGDRAAAHQRAYAKHIVETVKEHMGPNECGLVVCKKVLFDDEHVPPQWPENNEQRERFKESFTKEYGWNIEGRKVCATHWGTGIGSNDWQDANAVFLFDGFHIPRRIAAANVQGLREHKAHEGDLGSMPTMNSKARGVDIYTLGNQLRWTKQLALRGRARSYDEHGVCGRQRLVISTDLKSFLSCATELFPGAIIRIAGDYTEEDNWTDKILYLLSNNPKLPPTLDCINATRLRAPSSCTYAKGQKA